MIKGKNDLAQMGVGLFGDIIRASDTILKRQTTKELKELGKEMNISLKGTKQEMIDCIKKQVPSFIAKNSDEILKIAKKDAEHWGKRFAKMHKKAHKEAMKQAGDFSKKLMKKFDKKLK